MSALTFKRDGDARQWNALRQALKSKLPVLVLHNCVVEVNTTPYDTEYILDRIKNVPVCSVSPTLVGKQLKLNVTNTTKEVRIVTPNDFEGAAELFPPTKLRTFDGVVHELPIQILDLQPTQTLQLTCVITKALTGDDGRYMVAPVCHFKSVPDPAAAAKAYEELPEETKTPEHRKNWENLYSHQYVVPNSYIFTLDVVENSGYTNTTAIAAACDILVESITATKMWKVNVDEADGSHVEVVMDEFVGYLFEHALFGKEGVEYVKYGKRHPHDATGTLRVKTTSPEVDVPRLIQDAVDPLRRFYLSIASGVGGKTLHPTLQKALDSFKRATVEEKRARLGDLGVDRERAENVPEDDLDTMAEVWLRQTQRKAVPELGDDLPEPPKDAEAKDAEAMDAEAKDAEAKDAEAASEKEPDSLQETESEVLKAP
jgi:DNA-directed RNA polymerase subunit L